MKRKTDKDDALKLAKLTVLGQLPTARMPSPAQQQRRRLAHHRRVLVDRRTQVKNQVHSIFREQGLQLPPRGMAWTKQGVKEIAEHARPRGECDDVLDLWRGRPHVELHLLEQLSAQIEQVDTKLDALGRRTTSAGQMPSYAGPGLVPKQFESGTMKCSCRITRRGQALLRSMLIEVTWMLYIRNGWAGRSCSGVQCVRLNLG